MGLAALVEGECARKSSHANDNHARTEFDGGASGGHSYNIFPVDSKYLDRELEHYGTDHSLRIAFYNILANIKRDLIVKVRTLDMLAFPEHKLIYADGTSRGIYVWGTTGSMPNSNEPVERLEEEAEMMK